MRESQRGSIRTVVVLIAAFACAALLALLSGTNSASAHRLGDSSVDDGEIRYEEHSRFAGEIRDGAGQWNAVGSVDIREGGAGTDLEVRDYRNCNDGYLAYYLSDQINFNRCEMGKISALGRRWTAVHELGHALGLDHAPKKFRSTSIMFPRCCPFDSPRAHDKQDYQGLYGGQSSSGAVSTRGSESGVQHSEAGPLTIAPAYAFDAKDKRKLVGYATNVFKGRVLEDVGYEGEPLSGPGNKVLPQTQFSVEVLGNIKGNITGTVVLDRTGGYDEEGREVHVEGASPPEPGREYVFSTGYDRETGWYTVVALPYGAVPLEDEQEDRAAVEERFAAAEANQMPVGNDSR